MNPSTVAELPEEDIDQIDTVDRVHSMEAMTVPDIVARIKPAFDVMEKLYSTSLLGDIVVVAERIAVLPPQERDRQIVSFVAIAEHVQDLRSQAKGIVS